MGWWKKRRSGGGRWHLILVAWYGWEGTCTWPVWCVCGRSRMDSTGGISTLGVGRWASCWGRGGGAAGSSALSRGGPGASGGCNATMSNRSMWGGKISLALDTYMCGVDAQQEGGGRYEDDDAEAAWHDQGRVGARAG